MQLDKNARLHVLRATQQANDKRARPEQKQGDELTGPGGARENRRYTTSQQTNSIVSQLISEW
jgi:hypothetical protein